MVVELSVEVVGDLDVGEVRVTLAHEIIEASAAGSGDVDALLWRADVCGMRPWPTPPYATTSEQADGLGQRQPAQRGSGPGEAGFTGRGEGPSARLARRRRHLLEATNPATSGAGGRRLVSPEPVAATGRGRRGQRAALLGQRRGPPMRGCGGGECPSHRRVWASDEGAPSSAKFMAVAFVSEGALFATGPPGAAAYVPQGTEGRSRRANRRPASGARTEPDG